MNQANHQHIVGFIWSIANLLRDDFKRSKHPDVILPLTVLRRLDCALEKTKPNVLKKYGQYKGKLQEMDGLLKKASRYDFYNTSKYDFGKLLDDPKNIGKNLRLYINAYSPTMREIIEKFKFNTQIDSLEDANLTYQVIEEFSNIDLHPDRISNLGMGYVFEELIRKFNEASNENPGEHFDDVNANCIYDEGDLFIPGDINYDYDLDGVFDEGTVISFGMGTFTSFIPEFKIQSAQVELNLDFLYLISLKCIEAEFSANLPDERLFHFSGAVGLELENILDLDIDILGGSLDLNFDNNRYIGNMQTNHPSIPSFSSNCDMALELYPNGIFDFEMTFNGNIGIGPVVLLTQNGNLVWTENGLKFDCNMDADLFTVNSTFYCRERYIEGHANGEFDIWGFSFQPGASFAINENECLKGSGNLNWCYDDYCVSPSLPFTLCVGEMSFNPYGIFGRLGCPANLHVYDAQDRHVGIGASGDVNFPQK